MSNCVIDRIEKLRKNLKEKGSAFFITDEVNVGYFSGFQHSEGVFLLTENNSYLLVDFRYFEAAQKFCKNSQVVCFKKFTDDVLKILEKENIKTVFSESNNLTMSAFNRYKNEFYKKNIEIICDDFLDKAIADIRIIKSEEEFNKILKAQQIAEKAYLEVLNYIKAGVSERKIAIEFEYLMKKYGAERVSFDLITITGKKTSLPHGVPSDDIVKSGDFFTMDFGAVYEGYHSDTTRTVAVNFVSDEQREIYNIVLNAQLTALEVIKPDVKCCNVDKTARDIIENAGYGEFFGHSTGHGVGLQIHELPFVSSKSETILQKGMVITDEPGIYLPNKFGVRIEDMVYIDENGYKNFVSLPKELLIL